MEMRRIRAVARKEFLHIIRDVRSLILALALPVLMLVMFGFALSLDVDRIRTVVHDADRSSISRDLIEQFRASRFFEIQGYVLSEGAIQKMIDDGRATIGISILPGFGRNVESSHATEIQILLDGSDSNTASIALGYAETVVNTYSAGLSRIRQSQGSSGSGQSGGIVAPVDVRLRALYNSDMKSRVYIVPGLIAVIVMIIAALLTSMTIAREWEMGTMEQLFSTALRPSEIVLGKMAAYFCLGATATLISIITGIFVFDVPFRGSIFVLTISIGVFLCDALFWGIFVSAFAKKQLLALQISMVSSFMPAFLLSGFVYAIESMPKAIQFITLAIPTRHFVTIIKGVFLKGIGFEVLWVELLFLIVFAIVVFLATTHQLNGKLDRVQ
jgi:ABC-2 type transport system permease protein